MRITSKKAFLADLSILETKLRKKAILPAQAEVLQPIVKAEITKVSAMKAKDFRHYVSRFYKPLFNAIATAAVMLLFCVAGSGQVSREVCADENNLKEMLNVPCQCSQRDTAFITKYPGSYRSYFVATAFDFTDRDFIQFEVYFSEGIGKPLYLYYKGACRNFSNLVPLPEPGFYFIRFFHPTSPALVEIEARPDGNIYVRGFGKCSLKKSSK